MREILFRGKVINDCSGIDNTLKGQWHYGGYFYNEDDDMHFIRRADGHLCQVDPETVGQWTGLKDVIGAKIFDGDLLAFDIGGYRQTNNILWHYNGYWVVAQDGSYHLPNKLEVIGNIHDK